MKQKIKIAHVTFDMAIGGTEQVIRQLVENADPEQFESSILCIEQEVGDIGQEMQKKGIKIIALSRNSGFDFSMIKKIRNYIREQQIQILHCHQYSPYSYGLLAALGSGAKVIFTEHGRFYPDRSSWKRKLINPIFARLTHHITAISKATKDALVRFEQIPQGRIEVIYNGIRDQSQGHYSSQDTKQQLAIEPHEVVFGTIARLDPIKNHHMMLAAFAEVAKQVPQVKMMIVGDGPMREETEQHCAALGISERVIFTGFTVEPYQYLDIIDIFLLPSLSEGTSMTLLEAMSFAKPCIVTDVGGNPEIVLHDKTGVVIPNKDQSALAQACIQLAENQSLRKIYGDAGRKRFEEHLNVNAMVGRFEKIYAAG